MHIRKIDLSPPCLDELAEALQSPLSANYTHSSITVAPCPDLRLPPFHIATEGLCGNEKAADVGGQANLFPSPRLDCIWPLPRLATAMEMSDDKGSLIGAGAGPFHVIGKNTELAPNLSWNMETFDKINGSRYIEVTESGDVRVEKSPCLDCGLMVNLFGSRGDPGPVLRITAKGRKGTEGSFTECIRKGLAATYGERGVTLGGVFVVRGKAKYHVMPDFPPAEALPFPSREQVEKWLTFHEFEGPMVCMSVLHSADPEEMSLRMEHTHGFHAEGGNEGGHYHYDIGEEVEYEGYFNTARELYRIERPL